MTDAPQPTLAEQIAEIKYKITCFPRNKTLPAVLATLQRVERMEVERMEAVVGAAREAVAALHSARPNIDAAVIRLSVANHLMSRLAALDAAAPETETDGC